MNLSRPQKFSLSLAGVATLAIGISILMEPYAFYSSYGIILPDSPSLMSELRGTAVCLATSGIIILAGIFYKPMTHTSAIIAMMVFLSLTIGRFVSIAVDGLPSDGILGALIIEFLIAVLILYAFARPSEKQPYKLS